METKKYFTVHSLEALNTKQFSIIHANIDNTIEKVEIAKGMYPESLYLFEYHNFKHNLTAVN